MVNPEIWIVDDDNSIRWVLEKALQQERVKTRSFADAEAVMAALGKHQPDALITDVRMPGQDGLSMMRALHQRLPNLPVVVMTAFSDLDSALAAYAGGAFEYLPKPFDIDHAVATILRAANRDNGVLASQNGESPTAGIIGKAPAMQEVFRLIGRLSRSDLSVLVTGETGTGKELLATALHQTSPRSSGPFVALNTAAIPSDLLESELFGHEKGAFTGATTRRIGRFEQADGGTLFLDEIGDMPAGMQTRLLRVLAEGEFYRVGGHLMIKVDVRVIAATHQNLEDKVSSGEFRADLFHRLNVVRLPVPPLRERVEDIPPLMHHFLGRAASETRLDAKQASASAMQVLQGYGWPGNIRELENLCRRLTVMSPGDIIERTDLPPEMVAETELPEADGQAWEQQFAEWLDSALRNRPPDIAHHVVANVEALMMVAALRNTGGRKREAAELLGWGRNTLTRKLKMLPDNHETDQLS